MNQHQDMTTVDDDKTMQAAVLEAFGPPECYVRRALPIPSPGPNEALVRVDACGVCGEDIIVRRGDVPSFSSRLPLIQGHELAGEVVKVGSGVTDITLGDLIVIAQLRPCHKCEFCRAGQETLCANRITYGEDVPGGYGEYCVVDAAEAVKVPTNVDVTAGTVSACAVAVSVRALRLAQLGGGQRLVVTGAGGGVGVHALQVGRSYGAQTIAVTSSAKKRAVLEEFADEVIVGPETLAEQLRQSRAQPDIVLELTSGITFEQSIRAVRRGGTVVLVGNVDPRPVELSPGAMIMRETTVRGSTGAARADVVEAVRLISKGDVKPVIASVLPIERLAEAHRLLESARGIGRVVVTHSHRD
jgi:D-arabinose 1-dehydrogenase-like Zn-dependent alcohol dehydrogenase